MREPSHVPDPDLVYSLYTGGFKPQIVRIALLLDVFTPLVNGPVDAQAVAGACGCNVIGIGALLDYLSSLGLLKRGDNTYTLTPTAVAFLVPGQQSYAGGWILEETNPEFWNGALQALRSGQPCHHPFPWAQDAWLESYRPSRPTESLEMWRAAGIEPGQCPGLRVLDLACGCAIKSLVLTQSNPTVHVTCVDSAKVLEVACDLAERLQVLRQVTFLPGDMHSVDLGRECHDVALLGQITDYLTPKQNVGLFQRVYQSLSLGGILVIDVPMTTETPDEMAILITLLAWSISGGVAHSFAEYRNWLEEAGFKRAKQLGERWLSAIK